MALINSIQLGSGISVDNAYIKIESFDGNKTTASICTASYLSRQAAVDGKSSLESNNYSFPHSVEDGALNIVKQGYEHLKTLPEFVDSVDA